MVGGVDQGFTADLQPVAQGDRRVIEVLRPDVQIVDLQIAFVQVEAAEPGANDLEVHGKVRVLHLAGRGLLAALLLLSAVLTACACGARAHRSLAVAVNDPLGAGVVPSSLIVSFRRGLFDRSLSPRKSTALVFRKTGTYQYYCSYHPHMRGVVIVRP